MVGYTIIATSSSLKLFGLDSEKALKFTRYVNYSTSDFYAVKSCDRIFFFFSCDWNPGDACTRMIELFERWFHMICKNKSKPYVEVYFE